MDFLKHMGMTDCARERLDIIVNTMFISCSALDNSLAGVDDLNLLAY